MFVLQPFQTACPFVRLCCTAASLLPSTRMSNPILLSSLSLCLVSSIALGTCVNAPPFFYFAHPHRRGYRQHLPSTASRSILCVPMDFNRLDPSPSSPTRIIDMNPEVVDTTPADLLRLTIRSVRDVVSLLISSLSRTHSRHSLLLRVATCGRVSFLQRVASWVHVLDLFRLRRLFGSAAALYHVHSRTIHGKT